MYPLPAFFLRNFLTLSFEGGIYGGAQLLLAGDSVLPQIIASLAGPKWLIALMPVLGSLGYIWPQLLVAPQLEKLKSLKPYIMLTGALQRLPYLLTGIGLLFWGNNEPFLTLLLIALTPFISGSINGTNANAYLELVSRAIPPQRLASTWGLRQTIMTVIGIPAGLLVKQILISYPGNAGYALLHFLTFTGLILSFVCFGFSKEIRNPAPELPKPKLSVARNIANIPRLLKESPYIYLMLGTQAFTNGIYIMIPLLAIHAINQVHQDMYFLGYLVVSQMVGGIIGNLLGAYLGDNFGHKLMLYLSRFFLLLVCAGTLTIHSAAGFILIFGLLGAGLNIQNAGTQAINLSLAPQRYRAAYFSLLGIANFPALLLASLLCTIVNEVFGNIYPATVLAMLALGISLFFLYSLKEEYPVQEFKSYREETDSGVQAGRAI